MRQKVPSSPQGKDVLGADKIRSHPATVRLFPHLNVLNVHIVQADLELECGNVTVGCLASQTQL